jgi:amino acid transporter
MLGRVWRLLIGPVLSTRRARHERLPVLLALPVFASDALSSSAYATEEMMLVLWSAGEEALRLAFPISLAVVALLFIVVFSYRQTVYAYPQGGGAFIVSRENLGEFWGVLAASALLVGYVLTVAVSIAAGVNAIISAFPAMLPYRVSLCILFIALMTLINLRGARESGMVFAPPTYGFVLTFAILILVGLSRGFAGDIQPAPYPPYGEGAQALGLLVILTAFARGCSALTGVEAISDGVPAFRSPESRNAALTLLLMALILAGLVMGITYMASSLHVLPVKNEQGEIVETLTSRLARTVLEGTPFEWFYYVVQVATTLILISSGEHGVCRLPAPVVGAGERAVCAATVGELGRPPRVQQRDYPAGRAVCTVDYLLSGRHALAHSAVRGWRLYRFYALASGDGAPIRASQAPTLANRHAD